MPVKADLSDTRGIAQVLRKGWFKPVYVKSIGRQRARTLAAARIPSLAPNKSSEDFCARSVSSRDRLAASVRDASS
ncbi:hypothetical protein IVB21_32170 [Bradyrhizobium sp. 18]|nr:hypothetical protein [Bradyrhizobium sp. 18]